MCTDPEGKEMLRVFSKFYDGDYVGTSISPEEREALNRLYESSYIDIRVVGNREYAVASPLGKQFKHKRRTAVTKRQPSGLFTRSMS